MLNMKNMKKTRGFPDGAVVKKKRNTKKLGDSQVGTPANIGDTREVVSISGSR